MTTVHLLRHGAVDAHYAGVCFGQRVDPSLGPLDPSAAVRLRRRSEASMMFTEATRPRRRGDG
jgi:hypothetical protein